MADTIADYVARLGFKIDKADQARFTDALDKLAKTAAVVAASLTAAAATITTAVVAVSKQFDQLYFAAQRTNSTVTNIKALTYAMEQIGGSADSAQRMLDGLATALRTDPLGRGGFLAQLGVATSQNGKLRDTRDILEDLYQATKSEPYALSERQAGLLGISEEDWRNYTSHHDQIRKFEEDRKRAYADAGVDPEEAARKSNELMTSIRALVADVGVLLDKIVIELQPKLGKILAEISDWIAAHKDDIVKAINNLADAVGSAVDAFLLLKTAIEPVIEAFSHMAKLFGDDSGGIKTAMDALLLWIAGSWAVRLLGIFGGLGASLSRIPGLGWMFAGGMALSGAATGMVAKNPDAFKVPGGQANDDFNLGANILKPDAQAPADMGPLGWAWKGIKKWWNGDKTSAPAIPNKGGPFGVGTPPDPAPSATAPAPDMVKITTKSGQFAWVHKDFAPQFQGFVNDMEARGYKIGDLSGYANRANVNNPSQLSRHALGQAIDINPDQNPNGTTQTDMPADTAALAKKWGLGWGMNWQHTKDPMHFSGARNEGGHLMTPEELKVLQDAPGKTSSLSGQDSYLGGAPSGRTATLHQKTNITILGSSDPAGTAHNLGSAQSTVNSDLLRNAQSFG